MSAFWQGFFKAWASRTAIDVWLVFNGLALGLHLKEQAWAWAVVQALLVLVWMWFSRMKQREVVT